MVKIIQLYLLKYKFLVFLLFFCFVSKQSASQYVKEDEVLIKNTIYVEVGGNGLFISLNYDRIIKQNGKFILTGRGGVSYLSFSKSLSVPITFSVLYGKRDYFFEIGSGPTFHHYPYSQLTRFSTQGIIGVRFLPMENKGFMLRIVYTPVLGNFTNDKGYWNRGGYPFFGTSLGYSF
jgi:hypothetical protein